MTLIIGRNGQPVKPQAQILVIRNKLYYINCWNHMLLHGSTECVDAGGMTQYKAEVANILKKRYNYTVAINRPRIQR